MKTVFSISVFVILRSTIYDFFSDEVEIEWHRNLQYQNSLKSAIEMSFSFIYAPSYLCLGITDLIYKFSTHGSEMLSTQNTFYWQKIIRQWSEMKLKKQGLKFTL